MAKRSLLIFFVAAPLLAQQGRVAGPVAGYVFDQASQAVRPVLGIPGASTLGDPVNLGLSAASAWISPGLDSVIAVATDGSMHVFGLSAGVASEIAVNGVTVSAERVAFSPSGSAAAIYGGGRIQVLTQLPSAPKGGSSYDISTFLAMPQGRGHQKLTGSFAVSDDGAYALVATASGAQLLGAGTPRQLVAGRNLAVAFARGNHDAVIAGTAVTLVTDVGGAATPQSLAADGSVPPSVGAAFSADNSKLYVSSAAGRGVTGFDLAAGTSRIFTCDCTPSGLVSMGNVYRLNEAGAGPVWLFDTPANGPRIVFVPARVSE